MKKYIIFLIIFISTNVFSFPIPKNNSVSFQFNIDKGIYLEDDIKEQGAQLYCLKLMETENNYVRWQP